MIHPIKAPEGSGVASFNKLNHKRPVITVISRMDTRGGLDPETHGELISAVGFFKKDPEN